MSVGATGMPAEPPRSLPGAPSGRAVDVDLTDLDAFEAGTASALLDALRADDPLHWETSWPGSSCGS